MSAGLRLRIATPSSVPVDLSSVRAVRAEDESGSFGILPGHCDFLTVLRPSVLRWRDEGGVPHYCAVDGGVMTVSEGALVAVACRRATLGDDLSRLEADVEAMRAALVDEDRRSRVEQTRLHAHAVRQLMRYLRTGGAGDPKGPSI